MVIFIFLIPRHSGSGEIQKFAPEDEDGKRYLTFKFMVEALQFSDGGGFNIAAWIMAFCTGLTRICTTSKMATPTLKSFVVGGLIKGGI